MFQGEGGALTTSTWGKSGQPDMRVYNNIFVTNGRKNAAAVSNDLWTDGAGTFSFHNNIWWRLEGGVRFQWASSVATSWTGWQSMGFDPEGLNADPQLIGPWGGGPAAYHLSAASPAIDRARRITDALRGMGTQDAFGLPIPEGNAFDIGAFEYRSVTPDRAARFFAISRQLDGAWRLQFAGLAGRTYHIQAAAALPFWNEIGRATETSAGAFEFIDRTPGSMRFYRAMTP